MNRYAPVVPVPLLDTARYRYKLPQNLIAEHPGCERGASRLLHLGPAGDEHRRFGDLTELLRSGDLLVLNNTRVMPARLFGHKATGGSVEILVERISAEPHEAWVQLGASRTPAIGSEIALGDERAEIIGRDGRLFLLRSRTPWRALMSARGTVPLPPYIRRPVRPEDWDRYQTVYARTDQEHSVAAPTTPACTLPRSCCGTCAPSAASALPNSRCTSVPGPSCRSRPPIRVRTVCTASRSKSIAHCAAPLRRPAAAGGVWSPSAPHACGPWRPVGSPTAAP